MAQTSSPHGSVALNEKAPAVPTAAMARRWAEELRLLAAMVERLGGSSLAGFSAATTFAAPATVSRTQTFSLSQPHPTPVGLSRSALVDAVAMAANDVTEGPLVVAATLKPHAPASNSHQPPVGSLAAAAAHNARMRQDLARRVRLVAEAMVSIDGVEAAQAFASAAWYIGGGGLISVSGSTVDVSGRSQQQQAAALSGFPPLLAAAVEGSVEPSSMPSSMPLVVMHADGAGPQLFSPAMVLSPPIVVPAAPIAVVSDPPIVPSSSSIPSVSARGLAAVGAAPPVAATKPPAASALVRGISPRGPSTHRRHGGGSPTGLAVGRAAARQEVERVMPATLYVALEAIVDTLHAESGAVFVPQSGEMVSICNVGTKLAFPPSLVRHVSSGAITGGVFASGVALHQECHDPPKDLREEPKDDNGRRAQSLLVFPIFSRRAPPTSTIAGSHPSAVATARLGVVQVCNKFRGRVSFDSADEHFLYSAAHIIGSILERHEGIVWPANYYDPVSLHSDVPFTPAVLHGSSREAHDALHSILLGPLDWWLQAQLKEDQQEQGGRSSTQHTGGALSIGGPRRPSGACPTIPNHPPPPPHPRTPTDTARKKRQAPAGEPSPPLPSLLGCQTTSAEGDAVAVEPRLEKKQRSLAFQQPLGGPTPPPSQYATRKQPPTQQLPRDAPRATLTPSGALLGASGDGLSTLMSAAPSAPSGHGLGSGSSFLTGLPPASTASTAGAAPVRAPSSSSALLPAPPPPPPAGADITALGGAPSYGSFLAPALIHRTQAPITLSKRQSLADTASGLGFAPTLLEVDSYVASLHHCWRKSVDLNLRHAATEAQRSAELKAMRSQMLHAKAQAAQLAEELRVHRLDSEDYHSEYTSLKKELESYLAQRSNVE